MRQDLLLELTLSNGGIARSLLLLALVQCNAIAVRIPKDHHPTRREIMRTHDDRNPFGFDCSQGSIEIRYFKCRGSALG